MPNASGGCAVSKDFVKQQIAPVFIHEFQHMISYNQHVLIRGSAEGEQVWLNEGLSHFAEELGGRLLGNGPGQGQASSRLVQFGIGNILNANDYLLNPESHFLIMPGSSTGTLEERGAAWLFVRWLADHYAADYQRDQPHPPAGGHRTAGRGQRPGRHRLHDEPAGSARGRWPTTSTTCRDSRPPTRAWRTRAGTSGTSTTPCTSSGRTSCRASTRCARTAPRPARYNRTGTLRAGSGRHLRILQAAGAASVDVMLARKNGDPFPDDRARALRRGADSLRATRVRHLCFGPPGPGRPPAWRRRRRRPPS